ncbi:MAG: single-stranded DNA-binding protein [Clostridia bacterium]|nr:single-stranded DNA-binding protein [Clostridia bacterium]
MNVVVMSGRLSHTPELKQTPSGKAVCTFSLAVDRPRVKDVTDFYNFVAWEHTAEYIARAKKGDTVEVHGYLTTRQYEDRSGAKRTAIEVKVDEAHVIRKVGQSEAQATPVDYDGPVELTKFNEVSDDSDLPF